MIEYTVVAVYGVVCWLTDVPGATRDTMMGIFWSAPPWRQTDEHGGEAS